jgi:hypothetical protein
MERRCRLASAAMDELASVLRRERDLLDQLRFRFVETRLLLAAREIRYLRWATAEVDQARQRAQTVDLLRAARVELLSASTTHEGPLTLRGLANASQGPWDGILRDHHEGLCALVAEIEVIGHRNAELARSGIRQLADASPASPLEPWLSVAIHGPGESPATTAVLDIDAARTDSADLTTLAAETAFQEVISLAARLKMPDLLAFLR